jgi:hypothetical protein
MVAVRRVARERAFKCGTEEIASLDALAEFDEVLLHSLLAEAHSEPVPTAHGRGNSGTIRATVRSLEIAEPAIGATSAEESVRP